MKRQLVLRVGVALVTMASIAMALGNENRTITQIDTQPQRLLIHLSQDHSTIPHVDCRSNPQVMACDLADAYCEMAGKIALAAHLAGRVVDYDLSSTTCIGSVPRFDRFRISN